MFFYLHHLNTHDIMHNPTPFKKSSSLLVSLKCRFCYELFLYPFPNRDLPPFTEGEVNVVLHNSAGEQIYARPQE